MPEPTMRELREKYCGKTVVIDGKEYKAYPMTYKELEPCKLSPSYVSIGRKKYGKKF